jgi:hypothetical protein
MSRLLALFPPVVSSLFYPARASCRVGIAPFSLVAILALICWTADLSPTSLVAGAALASLVGVMHDDRIASSPTVNVWRLVVVIIESEGRSNCACPRPTRRNPALRGWPRCSRYVVRALPSRVARHLTKPTEPALPVSLL